MTDFSEQWLPERHRKWFKLLLELDQKHLFDRWSKDDPDARRDAFFAQIQRLDENYPGGLSQYVENARKLLAASRNEENPVEGFVPEAAKSVTLEAPRDKFLQYEETGMEHMGDAAFVLVAGGLGERLGYSGIKVALPIETTTRTSFLQFYIEYILAFQTRARRQRGDAQLRLPLMLMTSGDTHEPTKKFLEDNDYFGMDADQVTLLLQEKVASLADNDAHFVSSKDDPYLLETKPHGHGDVHALLKSSGLAAKWLQEGKRWIFFFQDTNGLAFRGFAAALGASVRENFDVNMIATPRTAGEAIGAIALLKHKDGRSMTASVEYNQLDALLPDGDVADASGYSPYPGNVNILVFALGPYCKTLDRTNGAIPEFVNPKYVPGSRAEFKKPTRLECLMQDYVKLDLDGATVGVAQLDRWLIFSPVKNALADAWALHRRGIPMESAASGEMDTYRAVCRILATSPDNEIADSEIVKVGDPRPGCGPLPVGPRLVLSPSFAVTVGELLVKLRRLKIHRGATLVIQGEDVQIEDLELDGTLIVRVAAGATLRLGGLGVNNDGWPICQLAGDGTDPEVDAIRGYRIERDEAVATVISSGVAGQLR